MNESLKSIVLYVSKEDKTMKVVEENMKIDNIVNIEIQNYINDGNNIYYCGGSLINKWYVLTYRSRLALLTRYL